MTPAASRTPSISCDEMMTLRSVGIKNGDQQRDAKAHEHRRAAAVGRHVLVNLALAWLGGVANLEEIIARRTIRDQGHDRAH